MINTTHINNWLALPNDTKLNIFQQTATQMGIQNIINNLTFTTNL
jgi:hypothetical protein